ncbi:MAG: hypothetical protein ABIC04_05695 [Nanoarchaeota archaeon]
MDIRVKGYLDRAENELVLAKANFELSTKQKVKNVLNIPLTRTFFNNVISEGDYAIFYSAKAFLISMNIKTEPPEEHKKTYNELKKIVESKQLDNNWQKFMMKNQTRLKHF